MTASSVCRVAYEVPVDADGATRERLWFVFDGVIYRIGSSLFGLRPVGTQAFSEDHTGLDHLGFDVASKDDLVAAAETLDELGVAHSGVKELGFACIPEFRDPGNFALELTSPRD